VPRHSEWTTALERPRHRSRSLPFTVTATDRGFLALGWDPEDGWTEWSSLDGARWTDRLVPRATGLAFPPDLLDIRLWEAEGAPLLTTITRLTPDILDVRIWRRTGPGQWVVTQEGPRPVAPGGDDVSATVEALTVRAGTTLLLLRSGSDAPAALYRTDGLGGWMPVDPPEGEVSSLVTTADGFAMVNRKTESAGVIDRLATSSDGETWTATGVLPTGALGTPQLAFADGTLFAFASDSTALTHGWRHGLDGSWIPVFAAMGILTPHSVAASGPTLVVLTRVDGRGTFSVGAVSRDGGLTWHRGQASEGDGDHCRLSVGVRRSMVVTAAGGCGASPVATRWAPGRGAS
jgi:hypothetical protein